MSERIVNDAALGQLRRAVRANYNSLPPEEIRRLLQLIDACTVRVVTHERAGARRED